MLENLKQKVFEANLELVRLGLVIYTWGNVSAIDTDSKLIVIKPSGLSYETMKAEDMTVVDLCGNTVEGQYHPSSDLPTHLELYKEFDIGAVVHTHSKWATIWSQAAMSIPLLGTTHADSFFGDIPVTRALTDNEIAGEYEKETGNAIVELFKTAHIDSKNVQGVLVRNHGPFTWGDTVEKAVENAAVLEYISEMAYYTRSLNANALMRQELLDKHFWRKHGMSAYYGQELEK